MLRRRKGLCAALLTVAVLGAQAQAAGAVILPAVTIDGPNQEIVGFGGVAMAEDGTGGVVYLKRVDGVAHVFVARYTEGHWLTPVRVDTEESYAASWPRIGASDGGELVVVWATPFATEKSKPVYELLSSTLGPGSSMFGPAMIVDPDIRYGVGASPDLAMSSTGQADVVYRVITVGEGEVSPIPLLHPGDVVEDVRVAHFNGEKWSRLGAINRDPGVSMRAPTASNAPQIAIGETGAAIVVWQEPDIDGVARIWARRIFGANLDYVLPVSAMSLGGASIGSEADAPSVAISRLGQAEVAYRQAGGAGSPLPGPRIFLNTLPDGESENGSEFVGASIADNAVAGGASATVGPPDVDIDEKRELRLLYDSNGTPRVVQGSNRTLSGTLNMGPPFAGSDQSAVSVMNPSGGGISAWPSADPQGHPAVAVREDFPEGGVQTALVSGGAGGEIAELAVGRSGLGDGLVAFQQGPLGDAAIVASHVSAPPALFVVNVPKVWVKPSQAIISWQPAPSANAPISYNVVLDGRKVPSPAGAFDLALNPHGLGSGRHRVQVLATDSLGQATLTPPATLLVDGEPPSVAITRTHGDHAVTVRIGDAYSGVEASAVSVSFGDGHGARGRTAFHHTYAHAGIYRIVVHVRNRLGIAGIVRRLVSVR